MRNVGSTLTFLVLLFLVCPRGMTYSFLKPYPNSEINAYRTPGDAIPYYINNNCRDSGTDQVIKDSFRAWENFTGEQGYPFKFEFMGYTNVSTFNDDGINAMICAKTT